MFKKARIKLTVWYLAIIMTISLAFSGAIYSGVDRELTRIENFQRTRIQGMIRGFPVPIEVSQGPDSNAIAESRNRIILTLGLINLSILILSGLGGYFLAGRTLDPIAEMVDEQKKFVGNASHELRTPLTSLTTEIEVALRDKNLDLNQAKKMLASNLEEVNKMKKLSDYLLKLNKLESRRTGLEMKNVDLGKIAINAIGKRKVKTDIKKTIVMGNEDALTELVAILLDNAFKYSPKGTGISLKVKNRQLEVSDKGMGILEKDLPHIFDRFYRADFARSKEKTDGYGLGLSIAKSIADLHGAEIKVDSKVGKGSTFTVTF